MRVNAGEGDRPRRGPAPSRSRVRMRRRAQTRCGIRGCGNFRDSCVVILGVVAIAVERQLGVLLGTLRFWGLWQPRSCHNSRFDNSQAGEIATTPNYATCETTHETTGDKNGREDPAGSVESEPGDVLVYLSEGA